MRIAVDARPLARPFTGIGRYTESLLSRLVQMGHQWYLYSDRPITPRFPIGDRVQLRVGNVTPGSALSLFYSQLVFPRWSRGDCVDLFWSPRHHLPLGLPSRVAGLVTVHDLVWKRYPETMLGRNRWLESWLMGPSLRIAEQVICVSEFTAREVAQVFGDVSGRCTVIQEAAESVTEHYEERFPLPGVPYLLFVGTLEPRKNLPRLLRAFTRAVNEYGVNHHLLVVGEEGWGNQDLPALIEELGLQGRVFLQGRVSDAELRDLYSGATALLMPSLYEGFGLPALEAMCHSVPVIAADCGALPEVVGEGGLLVDPHSEPALAAAIARICSDSALHACLAREAAAQAACFSWERAARQTLEVMEQVYNRRLSALEQVA